MPISMTQHAPQMPAVAYEQIIANVGQPLRESDGFISHAAEITPDGVTVTEVWETTCPPTHPSRRSPNCTRHSVARRQRRSCSRLQGRSDDARHRRD